MSSTDSCALCGSGATGAESDGEVTCYCAIDGIADIIAKKHGLEVIALLTAKGPMRYTDLIDHLNVKSPSTLSNRLTELAEEGVVERRRFNEIPPHVEYSLTDYGRELDDQLRQFREWAAMR